MSVIYILWLRQLKRYWRSRARLFGSLGQPLLFLLAFGFGFGPMFSRSGGGNYIQFLAPGIIAMSVLSTAMFSGIELIWDRQFGFLKETLVAPVPRRLIMIGKTLGGATVATMQGVVVCAMAVAIGFRPTSLIMLPVALVVMFLIAVLFTALGMTVATRMRDMHAFPLIMNFLIMPLFFLSGALFPLDGLPGAMLVINRLDPLTYGVDALRIVLTNGGQISFGLDMLVLSVVALILVTLGAWLFTTLEAN
ncbi:MAG: ABC transporter permease [Patescibacteria group bacterium]